MINQEMETMEYKNILLFSLVFLLVITPMISAKGLEDIEPAQINKEQLLDKEYIVKSSGTYFKDLKQDNPIVYIDKKVGTTYHVDSTKTFNKEENESVTLEFFYEIQPDYIAHYTHSGKFDRYYFPTQWTWESNCSGEICNGGWVTIEVENIEEGTGSSTFPIGITGPTWANDGQFFGEFDGVSSNIQGNEVLIPQNTSMTVSLWFNAEPSSENSIFIFTKPYGSSIGSRAGSLRIDPSNKHLFFIMVNSTGDDQQLIQSDGAFLSNTWHHAVAIYRNSTGNTSIYLDGEHVISELFTPNSTSVGTQVFQIATELDTGTPKYFNGKIDEVLFYNKNISDEEVLALYNNYSVTSTGINRTGTPSTTGLVLDINFDDFSVADNSGQANHGTNTNVSFGEVFSIFQNRIEDIDYTIVGDSFTIIDPNLAWMGLNLNWIYSVQTGSGAASSATIDAFSTYPALVGLVGTIVFLGLVIAVLVGSFVFGGKRGV